MDNDSVVVWGQISNAPQNLVEMNFNNTCRTQLPTGKIPECRPINGKASCFADKFVAACINKVQSMCEHIK